MSSCIGVTEAHQCSGNALVHCVKTPVPHTGCVPMGTQVRIRAGSFSNPSASLPNIFSLFLTFLMHKKLYWTVTTWTIQSMDNQSKNLYKHVIQWNSEAGLGGFILQDYILAVSVHHSYMNISVFLIWSIGTIALKSPVHGNNKNVTFHFCFTRKVSLRYTVRILHYITL